MLQRMKSAAAEQFVVDAKGQKVGVLLDLRTYDRLRDAEEELAEIRAYDAAKPKVHREIERGEFDTLQGYLAKRRRR